MSLKLDKARDVKRYFEDAEESGREAKRLLKELGDPDGIKRADSVEREAREGREYIERRLDKSSN